MERDYDFDSYEEYENEDYDCSDNDELGYNGQVYEWTDEDAWDALTDGMYGEMPSDPSMFDAMKEALGY